jgi:hypothetical protein
MQRLQQQCQSQQHQQQKQRGGLASGATAAALGWTAASQQLRLASRQAAQRCCPGWLLVQAAVRLLALLLLGVAQLVAGAVGRPGAIAVCLRLPQQPLPLLVVEARRAAGQRQVHLAAVSAPLLALLLQAAAAGPRAAVQMAAARHQLRQQQPQLAAGLARQHLQVVRALLLQRRAARAVMHSCCLRHGQAQLQLPLLEVCVRMCSRLTWISRWR